MTSNAFKYIFVIRQKRCACSGVREETVELCVLLIIGQFASVFPSALFAFAVDWDHGPDLNS